MQKIQISNHYHQANFDICLDEDVLMHGKLNYKPNTELFSN